MAYLQCVPQSENATRLMGLEDISMARHISLKLLVCATK